jgi:hypothetical protein
MRRCGQCVGSNMNHLLFSHTIGEPSTWTMRVGTWAILLTTLTLGQTILLCSM